MVSRVESLVGKYVKYVACGGLHTVCITSNQTPPPLRYSKWEFSLIIHSLRFLPSGDDEVYLLGFKSSTGLESSVIDEANPTIDCAPADLSHIEVFPSNAFSHFYYH